MFPGIAEALHEIRTTASDEERAWEEYRARHTEHIHKDYRDHWWPAEETGLRVMQAARRKVNAWRLANPNAHPPNKKAKLAAAEEEAEHVAHMYELQRRPLRRKTCNWMANGSIPLLTDAELLEAMPTTMDWAMRRVLRDRTDAELKEKANQPERETKTN